MERSVSAEQRAEGCRRRRIRRQLSHTRRT
jgi:hypothetical protein